MLGNPVNPHWPVKQMDSSEHPTPVHDKAVFERLAENRLAVLLVGNEERELHVPVEQLPPGASPGCWLRVTITGRRLVKATIDADQTERVAAHISKQLARLRQRGSRLRPE